jgi:hypothetical protein
MPYNIYAMKLILKPFKNLNIFEAFNGQQAFEIV